MNEDKKIIKVERLVSNALGFSKIDGLVHFIPGALAQELVEIKTDPIKNGATTGEIIKILEASPYRVEPDCPLFCKCGGCDFLHVNPSVALKLKAEATLEDFSQKLNLKIELNESPEKKFYRNRVNLHLEKKINLAQSNDCYSLGFYNNNKEIIEFSKCFLMGENINKLVNIIKGWLNSISFSLPTCEVIIQEGLENSGTLLGFKEIKTQKLIGYEKLKTLKELLAINMPEVKIIFKENLKFSEYSVIALKQEDYLLKSSLLNFTQVNPFTNKILVETIINIAKEFQVKTILDLYSGLGNFAIPLAKNNFYVTAVEESPEAVKAAKFNSDGIKNFTQIQSSVSTALKNMKNKTFELVILDPPRKGAKDLAPAIASMGAKHIIYIACQPSSLIRDYIAFQSLGYKAERLLAFDMFPRTSHLESCLIMSK